MNPNIPSRASPCTVQEGASFLWTKAPRKAFRRGEAAFEEFPSQPVLVRLAEVVFYSSLRTEEGEPTLPRVLYVR